MKTLLRNIQAIIETFYCFPSTSLDVQLCIHQHERLIRVAENKPLVPQNGKIETGELGSSCTEALCVIKKFRRIKHFDSGG